MNLVSSKKLDLSESTSVSYQGLVHRRESCGVLRWTMRMALDPFRLLLISLAAWLNQQQQEVMDYLQEENRVLREQLAGLRLRFSDDQRRRGGQSPEAGPAHAAGTEHDGDAESPRGFLPRGALRSVPNCLQSHGSCHPVRATALCYNQSVPPVAS